MKKLIICFCSMLFIMNWASAQTPKTVGILLFNGVQIIDYTGPYETLGGAFKVYTIGNKPGLITTNMGMQVQPNYTIDNCPKMDILVFPGGSVEGALNQANLINWVKRSVDSAQIVMSVCNGAFFLQRAGLLNGLTVTTTARFIDSLQSILPDTKVVRDKRYVDNGKIITTAGLSSGIDGALRLLGRVYGEAWEPIFAGNMEYNWSPESKYTVGTMANRNADKILLFIYSADSDAITYADNTEKMTCELVVRSRTSSKIFFENINKQAIDWQDWKLEKSDGANLTSTWSFTGYDSKPWIGVIKIKPTDKEGQSDVVVKIQHADKEIAMK